MEEGTGILPGLPAVAGKPVHVGFDGGRLTSDGGILLLAAVEQRLKVGERLAACIEDLRDPDRVVHEFAEMIRYRALLIAAGYPDGNDCDALRSDPAFKMAVGRLPESGDRPRNPDRPAFDCEIAGLVDRSTQELRRAWRTSHHTGPPLGLSRDLSHQGCRRQAATARPWRPDLRLAAPLADFGGRVRERHSFVQSRRSAEERRDLGAAVARTDPYRPRARGRVRIRWPAVSIAHCDCRADHRGTLVGVTVLWSRQASKASQ
jgi:hypothetical protein